MFMVSFSSSISVIPVKIKNSPNRNDNSWNPFFPLEHERSYTVLYFSLGYMSCTSFMLKWTRVISNKILCIPTCCMYICTNSTYIQYVVSCRTSTYNLDHNIKKNDLCYFVAYYRRKFWENRLVTYPWKITM